MIRFWSKLQNDAFRTTLEGLSRSEEDLTAEFCKKAFGEENFKLYGFHFTNANTILEHLQQLNPSYTLQRFVSDLRLFNPDLAERFTKHINYNSNANNNVTDSFA